MAAQLLRSHHFFVGRYEAAHVCRSLADLWKKSLHNPMSLFLHFPWQMYATHPGFPPSALLFITIVFNLSITVDSFLHCLM